MLTRGTNVDWFFRGDAFKLDRKLARAQARMIRAIGCRNIRIPIQIDNLRDKKDRNKPDVRKLPELGAAVEIAIDEGLAVIIDPFHRDSNGPIIFPNSDDCWYEDMAKLWFEIAKYLTKYDPEMVFLEVANEPRLDVTPKWYELEVMVLEKIRLAAPDHTIIAVANMAPKKRKVNLTCSIIFFPEIEDKNVIYNFHYYRPSIFTHQGISSGMLKSVAGVPYPSDPEIIVPTMSVVKDVDARNAIEQYGYERWSASRIESELSIVNKWAIERGICVTCNEFGVRKEKAPVSSRIRWILDVRQTLEKYNIGWTIWCDGFGFIDERDKNHMIVDDDVINACGLKAPDNGLLNKIQDIQSNR